MEKSNQAALIKEMMEDATKFRGYVETGFNTQLSVHALSDGVAGIGIPHSGHPEGRVFTGVLISQEGVRDLVDQLNAIISDNIRKTGT